MSIDIKQAQLMQRANWMGIKAKGLPITVRLDKHTTLRGTIVSAVCEQVRIRARPMVAVWTVVVEAGVNKTHHTVYLETLPRG